MSEITMTRKTALQAMGVAAASLAAGALVQGSPSLALATEANRNNFLEGAVVLDEYIEDPGDWQYVLSICDVRRDNSGKIHYDESMEMNGFKYRNGAALINGSSNYTYFLYFDVPSEYAGFSAVLGNIDGKRSDPTKFSFYLDDVFIDDCTIEAHQPPKMFALRTEGAYILKIVINVQQGTNAGIAEMRLHESMDFLAGMKSNRIPAAVVTGYVLPDGDYEATVDDNGDTAVVRVSIADNLITGLSIESQSGSASVSALTRAFGEILSTYGIPAEEAPQPAPASIMTTLLG
ncbi:MAG: hypothetical protein IKE43_07350 [Coriobacteriales bacterium]|nr:hypothetical protein [Coriobacteriales bacterium]